MNIFCIIPAYNEAKTIVEVINKVKPLVNKVVVVDDASSDKTLSLAQKQGVVVLKHTINRGQGAALQTGNEYAINNCADIIIHFDADGQFVAEEIKEVVQPIINRQADIVFGSRFLNKESNIPWLKKYIILSIAKIVNNLFLGINLSDPQNGFRAMARKAAQKITIQHDGMAHCSEIIYKAFGNRLKIIEVPVTIIYQDFGQRLSGGIKIIKDLLLGKLVN